MAAGDIDADLAKLVCTGAPSWRADEESITVFKSVGFASLDLIAAEQMFCSDFSAIP